MEETCSNLFVPHDHLLAFLFQAPQAKATAAVRINPGIAKTSGRGRILANGRPHRGNVAPPRPGTPAQQQRALPPACLSLTASGQRRFAACRRPVEMSKMARWAGRCEVRTCQLSVACLISLLPRPPLPLLPFPRHPSHRLSLNTKPSSTLPWTRDREDLKPPGPCSEPVAQPSPRKGCALDIASPTSLPSATSCPPLLSPPSRLCFPALRTRDARQRDRCFLTTDNACPLAHC